MKSAGHGASAGKSQQALLVPVLIRPPRCRSVSDRTFGAGANSTLEMQSKSNFISFYQIHRSVAAGIVNILVNHRIANIHQNELARALFSYPGEICQGFEGFPGGDTQVKI